MQRWIVRLKTRWNIANDRQYNKLVFHTAVKVFSKLLVLFVLYKAIFSFRLSYSQSLGPIKINGHQHQIRGKIVKSKKDKNGTRKMKLKICCYEQFKNIEQSLKLYKKSQEMKKEILYRKTFVRSPVKNTLDNKSSIQRIRSTGYISRFWIIMKLYSCPSIYRESVTLVYKIGSYKWEN